ncbi:uncharacterized protein METZ01_LOCUS238086, partial [marine metagenome]
TLLIWQQYEGTYGSISKRIINNNMFCG